ncbi:MAG: hypothetical protein E7356_01640 [Clostridiales bacterium]|nr:hypothetical protein [Clostridiales bacterium]
MDNQDIVGLITAFKEYRDMLTPIEECLKQFSSTYESLSADIAKLNGALDGNIQDKLDKIYKDLSLQADKSKSLASQIDRLSSATSSYISGVDKVINFCGNIESKLKTVEEIERKAESQIERLNLIIEDKKKTYNIKALEKSLEMYNTGVQQVSEFINKDVATVIASNSDRIGAIKDTSDNIMLKLSEEKTSIDNLIESYKVSNDMLKKVVEKESVNEEYIFAILDKWALDRRVKTKK